MEWLLPLGSHKVMGSFAGYSVSASTFEKSFGFFSTAFSSAFFSGFFFGFFQRLFLLMLRFDGLPSWTFFFPRPRTSHSWPCTYRSTFPLPQDFLDVIFFSRPCLLFRTTEDFLFYDQPEAVLFFLCLKKTCDV